MKFKFGFPRGSTLSFWAMCQLRKEDIYNLVSSQNSIGFHLQSISFIGEVFCTDQRIQNDKTCSSHSLFTLLLSGNKYTTVRYQITRIHSSFFPEVVWLPNSSCLELISGTTIKTKKLKCSALLLVRLYKKHITSIWLCPNQISPY